MDSAPAPFRLLPTRISATALIRSNVSYELACTVNFLTGFNVLVPKTLSIAGIKTQGQLDRSGESFIGSNVSGVVQTMNFSDGSTNFRVCGFHINGIKMP